MKYSPRQLIALADPCFEAMETAQPQFCRYGKYRGHMVSSILTANVGTE